MTHGSLYTGFPYTLLKEMFSIAEYPVKNAASKKMIDKLFSIEQKAGFLPEQFFKKFFTFSKAIFDQTKLFYNRKTYKLDWRKDLFI